MVRSDVAAGVAGQGGAGASDAAVWRTPLVPDPRQPERRQVRDGERQEQLASFLAHPLVEAGCRDHAAAMGERLPEHRRLRHRLGALAAFWSEGVHYARK
nr:hypothetical protein [Capsulimonas corticalis]